MNCTLWPVSEVCLLMTLLSCFMFLLSAFFFFGFDGILAYVVLGNLVANIQVFKIASFGGGTYELVQGTVVFCSLFWAYDMIVEFYGFSAGVKSLKISFLSIFVTLFLLFLTTKMTPSVKSLAAQSALETLFLPAPRIFVASVCAYLVSQYIDMLCFARIRAWTGGHFVWLRSLVSTVFGSFVDHLTFSWLAWRVLSAAPMPSDLFWQCYVFSGFGMRMLLSFGSPVVLYLGYTLRRYKCSGGWKG
jgi:uncharacterized integral membrane protein (TIGR00697 family)